MIAEWWVPESLAVGFESSSLVTDRDMHKSKYAYRSMWLEPNLLPCIPELMLLCNQHLKCAVWENIRIKLILVCCFLLVGRALQPASSFVGTLPCCYKSFLDTPGNVWLRWGSCWIHHMGVTVQQEFVQLFWLDGLVLNLCDALDWRYSECKLRTNLPQGFEWWRNGMAALSLYLCSSSWC